MQAWTGMIHVKEISVVSIKKDCIFAQSVIDAIVVLRPKHENNSFPKYSGGVGRRTPARLIAQRAINH